MDIKSHKYILNYNNIKYFSNKFSISLQSHYMGINISDPYGACNNEWYLIQNKLPGHTLLQRLVKALSRAL